MDGKVEAIRFLVDEFRRLRDILHDYRFSLLTYSDMGDKELDLRNWVGRCRDSFPAMLERLREVRVVRRSAVVIGDQARESAIAWIVELGDKVGNWVLCEEYLDKLDVTSKWLVDLLGIDLEYLLLVALEEARRRQREVLKVFDEAGRAFVKDFTPRNSYD